MSLYTCPFCGKRFWLHVDGGCTCKMYKKLIWPRDEEEDVRDLIAQYAEGKDAT